MNELIKRLKKIEEITGSCMIRFHIYADGSGRVMNLSFGSEQDLILFRDFENPIAAMDSWIEGNTLRPKEDAVKATIDKAIARLEKLRSEL